MGLCVRNILASGFFSNIQLFSPLDIFSFIKKFREFPHMVLSERALVTMQTPFMDSYVKLLIVTCHKRGAHAMGGMSAFIPIKEDEVRNRAVLDKVRQDKLYEVQNGHDGTWVAHPGLIPVAKEVFDNHMKGPNQIHVIPEAGKKIKVEDLIRVSEKPRVSEAGLINNISAAAQYIEAWLNGVGAVAINNLMEDAATAEISRAQLWSWIHHQVKLDDGRVITKQLVDALIQSEIEKLRSNLRENWGNRQFPAAFDLLRRLVFSSDFSDFLTLDAYGRILDTSAAAPGSTVRSTDADRDREAAEIHQWWSSPRFQYTKRPYGPEEVMRLRGSLKYDFASNQLARKLYWMLREFQETKQTSLTFGCLDTVQVAQMAKYLTSVYVSGWQSSSTAATTNEPGPDFADYPYNTVPNKVDQLFKAQMFHDRKQRNERANMSPEEIAKLPEPVDFLRPIIADGDTGHGGLSATMKLIKEFVAAGAAGVHIEDQRAGAKKCGHMAGKVLVSTQEHIDRLCAARLQCDILGVETVLVARTDAEAANMIDSNIDPRDQPFIEGTTKRELPALNEILRRTDAAKSDAVSSQWEKSACLCTYFEAILTYLQSSNQSAASEWAQKAEMLSWADARTLAQKLGAGDVFWCAEKPRTREGFYRLKAGVKTGIARAIAFAPYADVLWLETKKPDLKDATEFSRALRSAHPHAMMAYNLSPSFNWSAHGMSDPEIRDFVDRLANLGYIWQFITLAGFHADGLAIDVFAREFAQRKMLAYVELIQRPEGKEKVETLKHQHWSGAYLMDNQLVTATGGLVSTLSMGAGVTESQFKSKL
jgi:isocitrate lyase